MLLRRITKHLKDQNWFAVTLDFIIVVIGVAVAMMGQQWLSERDQRTNTEQAEKVLQDDLHRNYFNAKERVAVSKCRIEAYQSIAQKLLEPEEEWIGMPREEVDVVGIITALPNLLRSPSRGWGSNNWHAELGRGTFSSMDIDRRNRIDSLFKQTEHAEKLQREIYTLQGRIKTLAFSTRIGKRDRLRYLDSLGEMDLKSGLMELIAGQIATSIENIGIDLSPELIMQGNEIVAAHNKFAQTVYGDCYVPFNLNAVTEPSQQDAQP
ncbi:hypothetical protein [uncultured Paraglaciecola sp.]|uniref:hypothetical protein n=1 Tax=uncultured Paraglaciecola sp. TaxID=1765024 RepID=UPI0026362336|nr:hypothetical protein [uncultured Paraglaciecola sp.]